MMNISQFTFLLLIMFGTACSSNPEQTKETPKMPYKYQSQAKGYDTAKYNETLIPDTTGCWKWISPSDKWSDTLWNELVIVKDNGSYRVLYTTKMRNNLWPCFLPSFIKVGDTLIVSGNIYDIQKSESMPGNPTLLKKIFYHK